MQGHCLHIVGAGEQWVKELPGLVGAAEAEKEVEREKLPRDLVLPFACWENVEDEEGNDFGDEGVDLATMLDDEDEDIEVLEASTIAGEEQALSL